MRIVSVILVMLLVPVAYQAQYNSDYRPVARKKIKSASTFTISKEGDTTFYRYTYDTKGRLIETRDWRTNDFVHEQTYSTSGKLISEFDLHMQGDDRTIKYSNGVYTEDYDTAWIQIRQYDEITGYEIYDSILHFDMYLDGKPNDGWLLKSHGDTTFYYEYQRDSFRIHDFYIKRPVDSMKLGYSVTTYAVRNKDPHDDNSARDTFVSTNVSAVDKNGQTIRSYDLRSDLVYTQFVCKPDGMLYSQVNDSTAHLKLYSSYVNYYWKDGSLDYWIRTDIETGETSRYDHPKQKQLDSLNEIQKYGPITIEYYE